MRQEPPEPIEPTAQAPQPREAAGRPRPAPAGLGSALLERCERAVTNGREVRATCAALGARMRLLAERMTPATPGAPRARDGRSPDLAMLAHDLRSPLAAVLNWTEVLRVTRGAGGRFERAVEAVQGSGLEALKLVERLIEQVAPGAAPPGQQRVCLADALERVVHSLAVFAEQRGVVVSCGIGAAARMAKGDPVPFGRVVRNLLEFALRHTAAKGRVRVALERACDGVRLTICAEGISIPPAELPRLFHLR